MSNQIKESYNLVWSFRNEVSGFWPTPNPVDSLRYAFTEAGEAMDAFLRWKRPDDSRNSNRNVNVNDELTDCAIMLITSMDVFPKHLSEIDVIGYFSLEQICHRVSMQMVNLAFGEFSSAYTYATLHFINQYVGNNLKSRIVERLRRIASKHAPDFDFNRWLTNFEN